MTTSVPTLLTVKQFNQKHPAFPIGGLRHHIFHEHQNGFSMCVRRIGRRVLIDEQAFFEWVDAQGNTSHD